jgi:acetylornithine deacetylase/succinyl-diaminopimelate desuccinylase-like protein
MATSFGRGALDFKGGMAVFARAAMMLAERKVPLDRDVIFLAEADEESGPYSTTWLASQAWQKIDCEFALNEGGWIMKGPERARAVRRASRRRTRAPMPIIAHREGNVHPRVDAAARTTRSSRSRGALAKVSAYRDRRSS